MSLKKIGTSLALIAVGTVVLGAISAIFIPSPYGIITALSIGIGGGLWMRTFFDDLKM